MGIPALFREPVLLLRLTGGNKTTGSAFIGSESALQEFFLSVARFIFSSVLIDDDVLLAITSFITDRFDTHCCNRERKKKNSPLSENYCIYKTVKVELK